MATKAADERQVSDVMEKLGVYLMDKNSENAWALDSQKDNMIGRSISKERAAAPIILRHKTVSKAHARIWLNPQSQRWYLENMSRNGSFVNGKQISGKAILKHGDQIQIGPYQLLFYENFQGDDGTVEIAPLGNSFPKDGEDASAPISIREAVVMLIILAMVVLFFFMWFRRLF
jgi:pSer/pThr/pTyr-binding forkhead associated (FHA) protein